MLCLSTGAQEAGHAAGLRQLMVTHLLHKRDAVLELMRAGQLNTPLTSEARA